MRTSLALSAFLPALVLVTALPAARADSPAGTSATVTQAKKDEPLRFYGFAMDYSIYDATSLNSTNYSNALDQYFLPSWNFGKLAWKGTRFERATLSGRFLLERTLTGYDESSFNQYSDNGLAQPCSNLTPNTMGGVVNPADVQRCKYDQQHRWEYGDVWLTVSNSKIATIPKLEININPSVRFVLPTSLESRFQTLRLGLTGSLGASRNFLSDKLTVGYSFGFTKNFHQYTRPLASDQGAANGSGTLANDKNYAVNPDFKTDPYFLGAIGGNNASYGFTHVFRVEAAPTEKLSLSVLYIITDAFAYGVPDTVTYNGQQQNTFQTGMDVAGNSGSHILQVGHKDNQWFWATAGYQVLDWLNLSVALITVSPQRKPDGTLRQPFLSTDYNAFSQVSFGATVSIEKAAAKLF